MEYVRYIAKAIAASGAAFAGAVATGYQDGIMEAGEWWVAIGAACVALGGTYWVENGNKPS